MLTTEHLPGLQRLVQKYELWHLRSYVVNMLTVRRGANLPSEKHREVLICRTSRRSIRRTQQVCDSRAGAWASISGQHTQKMANQNMASACLPLLTCWGASWTHLLPRAAQPQRQSPPLPLSSVGTMTRPHFGIYYNR